MPPGRLVDALDNRLPPSRRRSDNRLAVPRAPTFTPLKDQRETFYEQRLLTKLAWHCRAPPEVVPEPTEKQTTQVWEFYPQLPEGCELTPGLAGRLPSPLRVRDRGGAEVSYEQTCKEIEEAFNDAGFGCPCCSLEAGADGPCRAGLHADGFHLCQLDEGDGESPSEPAARWKPGSLHNGKMDVLSVIRQLARRQAPLEKIEQLLREALEEDLIPEADVDYYLRVFEEEAQNSRVEDVYRTPAQPGAADQRSAPMTRQELETELELRERRLQERKGALPNPGEPPTDQWRLYSEITAALARTDRPARFFVQAAAGTGKSFLLETLYLWCLVHGHTPEACAPTGIAAARIHVPRTPVHATTLHYLFGLDASGDSRLNPGEPEREEARRLAGLTVLLKDEVSMQDDEAWRAERTLLSAFGMAAPPAAPTEEDTEPPRGAADPDAAQGAVGAAAPETPAPRRWQRRPPPARDAIARAHIVCFGDLNQLPPATSRPSFLAADPEMRAALEFRMLRENRRIAPATDGAEERQAELDAFQQVLEGIARGTATEGVRRFLAQA